MVDRGIIRLENGELRYESDKDYWYFDELPDITDAVRERLPAQVMLKWGYQDVYFVIYAMVSRPQTSTSATLAVIRDAERIAREKGASLMTCWSVVSERILQWDGWTQQTNVFYQLPMEVKPTGKFGKLKHDDAAFYVKEL